MLYATKNDISALSRYLYLKCSLSVVDLFDVSEQGLGEGGSQVTEVTLPGLVVLVISVHVVHHSLNPRHWRPHSLQILNFLVLSDIFFFVTSPIILVLGAGTLVLGRPLFFLCPVLPSLLRISNYKIKIPSPQYYPYLT